MDLGSECSSLPVDGLARGRGKGHMWKRGDRKENKRMRNELDGKHIWNEGVLGRYLVLVDIRG